MRALGCLLSVAISAACTYTTVNNPPLAGPGLLVPAGPPGEGAAAVVVTNEATPAASATNAQVCPAGQSCTWQCDEGNCAFECGEGASCDIQCDGGGCSITVATGASCNAQCDGGRCETSCAPGASCDFQCDGGACSVACGEGSTCNFDCDKGDCVTRTADAS
jgi:hypothetical protein